MSSQAQQGTDGASPEGFGMWFVITWGILDNLIRELLADVNNARGSQSAPSQAQCDMDCSLWLFLAVDPLLFLQRPALVACLDTLYSGGLVVIAAKEHMRRTSGCVCDTGIGCIGQSRPADESSGVQISSTTGCGPQHSMLLYNQN